MNNLEQSKKKEEIYKTSMKKKLLILKEREKELKLN